MIPDERRDYHSSVNLEEEEPEAVQPPSGSPAARKFLRRLWLVVFLILVIAVVAWGIIQRKRDSSKVESETRELAITTVSVVHPKRGAGAEEIPLPANIQPWIDAPIYARTSGYVKSYYVDIGSRVKKGDLLADIETPEVDQQLLQARADLNTAKANYDLAVITANRYQNLLKSGAVSQQDTDNAVAAAKAQKAMVDSADFNVRRLEDLKSFEKVVAPFNGVITARNTDIGQLINSGNGGPAQELFHIADTHTMRVYVNVPQVNSPQAREGLTADLTLTERPNQKFTGKLVRTARAIDQSSRTLLTEFDFDNPTGELMPGAYAMLHFKAPNTTPQWMLPVNTLIFRSQGLQVGVVRGDHVDLVSVTIGADYGTEVEISKGLIGDESVVVNPPDSLTPGQRVRIGSANQEEGKSPPPVAQPQNQLNRGQGQ
jgi:RND family efflux transporter MFP subunit